MGINFLGKIIGKVKDKASISKATLLSPSLHLTILKTTTHDANKPPSNHHLSAILSAGDGPRSSASIVIDTLMTRLHKTSSSTVALKCLLSLHVIIRRGTFILHDQLSVYPSTGGRNYLKLSDFRENSSPKTWEMSTWVRWYAKYLEQIITTSRVLGCFIYSSFSSLEKDKSSDVVACLLSNELSRELDCLVDVIDDISKCPDFFHLEGNRLLFEVMKFVGEDFITSIEEIMIRIHEFKERLTCLTFVDSVELVCGLKRLEGFKERVGLLFEVNGSGLVEDLWGLVSEMKGKVGESKGFNEEKKVLSLGRFDSARFGEDVVKQTRDLVRFSSNRFDFKFSYGEPVR